MSRVAVAIHDVAPQTLDACAEIRRGLLGRGIDRVTLLAVPAWLGSPCTRSPEHVEWLTRRRDAGDAIAQHGLVHVQTRRARGPRQWRASVQGGTAAEFVGLAPGETADALRRGREILRDAGIDPRGFVAPAYAYTRALRDELALRFVWWAELFAVRGPFGTIRAPALCLGASSRLKRATSPQLVLGLARPRWGVLRVDLHPADLEFRRTRAAVERLLDRAAGRTPVSYDDLAGSLLTRPVPGAV